MQAVGVVWGRGGAGFRYISGPSTKFEWKWYAVHAKHKCKYIFGAECPVPQKSAKLLLGVSLPHEDRAAPHSGPIPGPQPSLLTSCLCSFIALDSFGSSFIHTLHIRNYCESF